MADKFDFNALTYGWSKDGGPELHQMLVETFPTAGEAMDIALKAGLERFKLNPDKAVYYLWVDIVQLASSKNKLENVVDTASGFLNAEHPLLKLVTQMKNGVPVSTSNQPRNPDGSPKFLGNADTITNAEALLFQEDLTMEVGKLPALINTLQLLQKCVPAVCNLSVSIDDSRQHGTAFRIGDDILLTNWHVVHDKQGNPATAITAIFGFEDDGTGKVSAGQAIQCSTANINSDKDNDWAVVTAVEKLDNTWPIIKLSEAVAPVLKSQAFIIQHPKNESKRLGYVRNKVSDFNNRIVQYLTDTQEGSSGAPVLNADGKLIALHHAGGRPQEITGLPPVKKNEGILISVIRDALTQKGVTVP